METAVFYIGAHILEIAGFFIPSAFAYYAYSRKRFDTASDIFRNAFLTELNGLYPEPSDWPQDSLNIEPILREKFPRLQSAVEIFRHFVPWYRRRDFDTAWRRYRNDEGRDQDIQVYHHYIPFADNPNYKENFKDNIGKLLSFTNPPLLFK